MVEQELVRIVDIEAETKRAVLARVQVHEKYSFMTWIPKSVIDENRRIEDWFQGRIVEKFESEVE